MCAIVLQINLCLIHTTLGMHFAVTCQWMFLWEFLAFHYAVILPHGVLFQFLHQRRISSCQLAPRNISESHIDVLYHDVANSSIGQSYKLSKLGHYDHSGKNFESREHSYSDGIEIKHLSLTSDDYVEERLPAYTLDYQTYDNICYIHKTKFNNEVSKQLFVYVNCSRY